MLYFYHRWLVSHGLRLAAMCTLEHPDIKSAFGKVVECAVDHGKASAVDKLVKEEKLKIPAADISWYKADAYEELTAAMGKLKDFELSHIGMIERDQDAPIDVIMAGLTLARHMGENAEQQADFYLKPDVTQLKVLVFGNHPYILDPFRLVDEIPLQTCLNAHANRCALKKGVKGKAIMCGIGAAHQPRSDGVPMMLATVSMSNAELLRRMALSKEEMFAAGPVRLERSYSF